MTTQQLILSGWRWDSIAVLICAGVVMGPVVWSRRQARKSLTPTSQVQARPNYLPLSTALLMLIVALFSPVRVLADRFLFSAHMFQHLLLLLVIPPLCLWSLPRGLPSYSGGRVKSWLPASWIAGVGAMWFWHAPALCDAATSSNVVFQFQIVSLLVAGFLFWLPIWGPRSDLRLSPLAGVVYLFSACFACTLLGIYITFSPVAVCSIYAHASDSRGITSLIRNGWGLSAATDQRIGGLMMWVSACLLYLCSILSLLARWYNADEPSRAAGMGTLKPKHP